MGKSISKIKPYLKQIMWWFDFIMILAAYIAIAKLLVGKGLEWLIILLFMLLIIYLIGKILFYRSDIRKY